MSQQTFCPPFHNVKRPVSLMTVAMILWTTAFFFPPLSAQTPQVTKDAALTAPKIITSPGPQYDDENRDMNMNCGITKTSGGRLWACWISGGDSEDAFMVAARSDDDGRTWSKPCLVIDPPEAADGTKIRTLIASFWTDPLGRVWLFFDVGLGMFDGRVGLWATRCDAPDADEPVWTEPVRIYHGSIHNKPLVTKDGRWLLPAELYDKDYVHYNVDVIHPGHDFFPEVDDCRGVTILESKDSGESWNPIGRCPSIRGSSRRGNHRLPERNRGPDE